MKVTVNYDLCESNALCMEVMPNVFEVRADDFLYLLTDEIPAGQEAEAEEGVRRCPRQAISLQP